MRDISNSSPLSSDCASPPSVSLKYTVGHNSLWQIHCMIIVTCVWWVLAYNASITGREPLTGHQIAVNCSHYLCLDKYHSSNTACLTEGGGGEKKKKKHVVLKHNSQGEKFIQWGFVVVGRMMYSNGTVQLLSFRKQIMGWETGDAWPKTLCLTEVAAESVCACVCVCARR